MNVLVYVEGESDRVALETVLQPVREAARARRVGIQFLPLGGKARILKEVPHKAVGHLRERPEDWVFALPDLYPMKDFDGTDLRHCSFPAMEALLQASFSKQAQRKGLDEAVHNHFRVHCFKHDLEVLVLAAHEALAARLKTQDKIRNNWRQPVEDQNDDRFPKRVVQELFKRYRSQCAYNEISDATWILQRTSLEDLLLACPQHFAPFVKELKTLADGHLLPDPGCKRVA